MYLENNFRILIKAASHDLTRKGFNDLKCIASIIIQYAKKKKYIDYTPDDVFTEMDTNPRKLRIVMEDESKALLAAGDNRQPKAATNRHYKTA